MTDGFQGDLRGDPVLRNGYGEGARDEKCSICNYLAVLTEPPDDTTTHDDATAFET